MITRRPFRFAALAALIGSTALIICSPLSVRAQSAGSAKKPVAANKAKHSGDLAKLPVTVYLTSGTSSHGKRRFRITVGYSKGDASFLQVSLKSNDPYEEISLKPVDDKDYHVLAFDVELAPQAYSLGINFSDAKNKLRVVRFKLVAGDDKKWPRHDLRSAFFTEVGSPGGTPVVNPDAPATPAPANATSTDTAPVVNPTPPANP